MAPKTKGQKMDLGTFLTDSTLGSWADEMEDMPMPSGMPTSEPHQGLQEPAYRWKLTKSGPRPSYGAGMDRSASYAGGYGSTGGYGTRPTNRSVSDS
ncbi:MAG: hypothetical protein LQ351_006502 [Letrouitia transgressa]|nr:MAG: hypothetical protein LQ351_006502 [Letrouitia transgressa]